MVKTLIFLFAFTYSSLIHAVTGRSREVLEARKTQDVYWTVMAFKQGEKPRLENLLDKDIGDSEWDSKLSFDETLRCKFKRSNTDTKNFVSANLFCESESIKFKIGPARCDLNDKNKTFTDKDVVNFNFESTKLKVDFRLKCTAVPKEQYRKCPFDPKVIEKMNIDQLMDYSQNIYSNYCDKVIYGKMSKLKKKTAKMLYLETHFEGPDCYYNGCPEEEWKKMSNKVSKSCDLGYIEACYFSNYPTSENHEQHTDHSKKYCDLNVSMACAQLASNLYVVKNPEWKNYAEKSCKLGSKLSCDLIKTDESIHSNDLKIKSSGCEPSQKSE